MDIVYRRRETHPDTVFDSDRQMMSGVAQEFRRQSVVDRAVEHAIGDVVQDALVAAAQKSDLQGHVAPAPELITCRRGARVADSFEPSGSGELTVVYARARAESRYPIRRDAPARAGRRL